MINPNFQTSDPRAEHAPSSLFKKIMQRYIFSLEYAISANFLLFEAVSQLDDLSKKDYAVHHLWAREENPCRGSFEVNYTLETRL